MHVIDQADHRAPGPERGQVRHPVTDLDDEVGVAQVPGEGERRPDELGIRAAAAPDFVRALADLTAGQQSDPVTTLLQAVGQPVDQQLGPARVPVREIPPGNEDDAPQGA
jgi:hypothetical protein